MSSSRRGELLVLRRDWCRKRSADFSVVRSGVRLEGPFPDHSNATLRRYGRPEHFLRVSIREENLEKHRHDSKIDMNEVSRENGLGSGQ